MKNLRVRKGGREREKDFSGACNYVTNWLIEWVNKHSQFDQQKGLKGIGKTVFHWQSFKMVTFSPILLSLVRRWKITQWMQLIEWGTKIEIKLARNAKNQWLPGNFWARACMEKEKRWMSFHLCEKPMKCSVYIFNYPLSLPFTFTNSFPFLICFSICQFGQ